jgi:hypothetical protein
MTDSPKKPINIFEEVRKLNFSPDHFMVVGSGIMSVKGIRDAYDLDIVVSKELFDKCRSDGWRLMPWTRTGRSGKEWLKGDIADLMIEVQSGNKDYDLEELKKEGELIDGIWFLSLKQLIQFKKNYGRPKDFDDIKLMEGYLKDHSG